MNNIDIEDLLPRQKKIKKEKIIKSKGRVLKVKKKWLVFLLPGIFLIASLSSSVMAAQPITVTFNGEQLQFDVPPVLENGRVLVPIRSIFESLGANVDWDDTTNTITASQGNNIVKLTIGKTIAYKNGAAVKLDVPAKVVKGRTLVPVRFVSEVLGADVQWDSRKNMVSVIKKENNSTDKFIPLTFTSITTSGLQAQKLEEKSINEIFKKEELEVGKVILYSKSNDNEYIYAGFLSDSETYDLGNVGDQSYNTAITVKKNELHDGVILRIDGNYGADFQRSSYFLIKNDIPELLLQADGHVIEMDIDDDGVEEVISSYGSYTTTNIFKLDKYNKDAIKSVNINEQLGATSVTTKKVGQEIVLEAYYKSTGNTETFGICNYNGKLILSKVES